MDITLNINPDTIIPRITHPLGSAWRQPNHKNILIDDIHALMTQDDFNLLYNYQCSNPTGVYEGKMWRQNMSLLWWDTCLTDPNKCICHHREIIIVD
jgi:hypothetical protein